MSRRHRLRSLWTVAYFNGLLPILRTPLFLLNTVASPFSFLFFIVVVSHGALETYAIAGGMVLTMLSIGTSLQADLTHYKQDLKLQEIVVASPVEAPVYVAGMAVSEFLFSLPALTVFVVLWVLTPIPDPLSLTDIFSIVGTLFLVWAFATALGFTLATYFQNIRETFVFSPLLSLALTVLPPVYYPITLIPAVYRPLAYLSPVTYAGDLMHQAMHLSAEGPYLLPAGLDWLALIGFTIVLLAIAGWKARWRDP